MKSNFIRDLTSWKKNYPLKFASAEDIFKQVHPGDRIFLGTACAEPQALIRAMVDYAKNHPKALFDIELVQLWNQGSMPYAEKGLCDPFRLNSFFISGSTRDLIAGAPADCTPAFFSSLPDLIKRDLMPIDMALIQATLPDVDGNMSLGISVDAIRAAAEKATIVVAQCNSQMPYIQGDGIINILDLDYIFHKDEPLLEKEHLIGVPLDIVKRIGRNISRIVQDNATLQVGCGPFSDALLAYLKGKKHLGLHSEVFSDGVAELMREGVIDNSNKSIDPGAAVASLCLGKRETYRFLHNNPDVIFRGIEYTNSHSIICQQRNMIAINAAVQIDLTGQASCESLPSVLCSGALHNKGMCSGDTYNAGLFCGAGGGADFIRSAPLAPGGKSILVLPSISSDGRHSRILPRLEAGSSATVHQGDMRYVVTEYGIAYLYGKSLRERAMDLIAISHPRFRAWLVEEAHKLSLLSPDQIYSYDYPKNLESWKSTRKGLSIFLRPVKLSDEPQLLYFFSSLSNRSSYKRFASAKRYMPNSHLWEFLPVDPSRGLVIVALLVSEEKETIIGLVQYCLNEGDNVAELALIVRDDYQGQGIGRILHSYMSYIARRRGLAGFTAEVLEDNLPALGLITKMGFKVAGEDAGMLQLRMMFDEI